MDTGCGTGDFLTHFRQREQRPRRYMGMDIVGEFYERARERDADATFETHDLFNDPWPTEMFDCIIADGLFGHAQSNEDVW